MTARRILIVGLSSAEFIRYITESNKILKFCIFRNSYTSFSSTTVIQPYHNNQPLTSMSFNVPTSQLQTMALVSQPLASPATNNHHRKFMHKDWDINDTNVPAIGPSDFNDFFEWVDGHQRLVYPQSNEEARKHTSGWAMRNTNNHNVNILKKSCLGVLVCSANCVLPNGGSIHLRPAICDKARKKQQGKLCPNRYEIFSL